MLPCFVIRSVAIMEQAPRYSARLRSTTDQDPAEVSMSSGPWTYWRPENTTRILSSEDRCRRLASRPDGHRLDREVHRFGMAGKWTQYPPRLSHKGELSSWWASRPGHTEMHQHQTNSPCSPCSPATKGSSS